MEQKTECLVGNSLSARMTSVPPTKDHGWRKIQLRNIPLDGLVGLDPSDIAEFVEGEVDDACIEELLFGLTWLNWSSDSGRPSRSGARTEWQVENAGIQPTDTSYLGISSYYSCHRT